MPQLTNPSSIESPDLGAIANSSSCMCCTPYAIKLPKNDNETIFKYYFNKLKKCDKAEISRSLEFMDGSLDVNKVLASICIIFFQDQEHLYSKAFQAIKDISKISKIEENSVFASDRLFMGLYFALKTENKKNLGAIVDLYIRLTELLHHGYSFLDSYSILGTISHQIDAETDAEVMHSILELFSRAIKVNVSPSIRLDVMKQMSKFYGNFSKADKKGFKSLYPPSLRVLA